RGPAGVASTELGLATLGPVGMNCNPALGVEGCGPLRGAADRAARGRPLGRLRRLRQRCSTDAVEHAYGGRRVLALPAAEGDTVPVFDVDHARAAVRRELVAGGSNRARSTRVVVGVANAVLLRHVVVAGVL